MTSTSVNVGLTDSTRASSRVLRPPGGGHTDIFGGEPDQPPTRRNHNASSIHIGTVEHEAPKPMNGSESASQNGSQAPREQPQPEAAAAPAAAPAPEPKLPSPVSEPAKAEAPKRVRVPPGGFSSGLW